MGCQLVLILFCPNCFLCLSMRPTVCIQSEDNIIFLTSFTVPQLLVCIQSFSKVTTGLQAHTAMCILVIPIPTTVCASGTVTTSCLLTVGVDEVPENALAKAGCSVGVNTHTPPKLSHTPRLVSPSPLRKELLFRPNAGFNPSTNWGFFGTIYRARR